MENLDVLPAGRMPINPLALLASKRMFLLMEDFSTKYEFIIIDAPPLVGAADAISLGEITDGILLVARPGVVDGNSANVAKDMLAQSGHKVLGLVINAVKPKNLCRLKSINCLARYSGFQSYQVQKRSPRGDQSYLSR